MVNHSFKGILRGLKAKYLFFLTSLQHVAAKKKKIRHLVDCTSSVTAPLQRTGHCCKDEACNRFSRATYILEASRQESPVVPYHLSNQRELNASASSSVDTWTPRKTAWSTFDTSASSTMTRTLLDSVVRALGLECVCLYYITHDDSASMYVVDAAHLKAMRIVIGCLIRAEYSNLNALLKRCSS